MFDFLDMDSNKLVVSEFYENDKAGKYNYDASYQRGVIWSPEKKSFLIDSILKNYPIPPIFLRMIIDKDSGDTKYDVIDGKQRLTAIKEFINGDISLPDDFSDDILGNSELNGATFKDLDRFDKYKKQFWRYRIPIIFIETDEEGIIKNIFDRLNRNGEPLLPQELRNAKYGGSKLYKIINQITENNPWKTMLDEILETDRMEDKEFISELVMVLLEKQIASYTKETLDRFYEKWQDTVHEKIVEEFKEIIEYIDKLNLDYKDFRINKVSHLYAIWCVAYFAVKKHIDVKEISGCLNNFYDKLKNKDFDGVTSEYKRSMSSATKSKSSREKRVKAILEYLANHNIDIKYTF
jgi:uncharacterized protein with ParB-like and HNH nuclease domain